jgi:hypothetical protein
LIKVRLTKTRIYLSWGEDDEEEEEEDDDGGDGSAVFSTGAVNPGADVDLSGAFPATLSYT